LIQRNSILLWQDKWLALQLKDTWPRLHPLCKDEGISIKQALLVLEASDLFHLLLSEEALLQFHLFQALLLDLEPAMGMDTWKVFGNAVTTNFSCVYSSLVDFGGTIYALKWIWQGCCQQKHKVFFWLKVHERVNTREMLQRKNFVWISIAALCVTMMSWNLETICSSVAPLLSYVDNISALLGHLLSRMTFRVSLLVSKINWK
jgi:hypothetical protein